jgi:hypothetical protein
MADVAFVKTRPSGLGDLEIITWSPLESGDTGKAYDLPNGYSVDAHIGGTFGTGGSVTLYGTSLASDTGVAGTGSWATVADSQGNAFTKTAAACEAIVEQPLKLAPKCTAGEAAPNTAITVTLVLRRK